MRKPSQKSDATEGAPLVASAVVAEPAVAERAPRRARGHQRVEVLLAAAAQVFADKGYDAATMTEIAAQADSSIGSLYQFFPTKDRIAQALIGQQTQDLRTRLDAMAQLSPRWSIDELSRRLCAALIEFRGQHPSFARLVDTPGVPAELVVAVRRDMRLQLVDILSPHAPQLSRACLTAVAAVVQQVMKSAVALNADPAAESPTAAKAALQELRTMLRCYLESAFAA
jgi:AcrR family transcriptional regulator